MKKKFVLGVFLLVMSLLGPFQGLVKASDERVGSLHERVEVIEQNQILNKNKTIEKEEVLKKTFNKLRGSRDLNELTSFQISFF